MKNTIKVSNLCSTALTENNGLKLREAINNYLENNTDNITLDFSDIRIFSTPFFNSSIGFFIMKLTPEVFGKKIKITNLTKLGEETYQHTKENAEKIFRKNLNTDTIGKITKETYDNN